MGIGEFLLYISIFLFFSLSAKADSSDKKQPSKGIFSIISPFVSKSRFSKKREPSSQTPPETEAMEEGENFKPSLSETVHDSHQLKSRIKRQLARELETDPLKDMKDKSSNSLSSEDETARFGDLEIGISERGEEELVNPDH